MEERFAVRLKEMLAQCEVAPDDLRGTSDRLARFVEPFAGLLGEPEQREHVGEYVAGLLSKLDRKTGESIAYLHDKERQGIQKFVGQVPWDERPLVLELARQVGREIGEADAVLVFDPSGHVKKGKSSVGVARQWCGRVGKTENCQVGISMGYVSRKEHALVDTRLYLPKEWTKDRKRCKKAGVPKGTKFKTRHTLALEMLDELGPQLPHAWIAGDDEMGRSSLFRRELRNRGERYLLDVPSNTRIRDLEAKPPEYSGRGRKPKRKFERADQWMKALPDSAWTKIVVRDAEKGPLEVEAVKCRVTAKSGAPDEEMLFITRQREPDGSFKHDYHLSNAPPETPLEEFARVSKAEHRIEECLERAKGEAGLSDYQVRTWRAWHHHQTLCLIAAWFLTQETRRGKNPDPRADAPAGGRPDREPPGTDLEHQHRRSRQPPRHTLAEAERASTALPPPFTQDPAIIEEPTQLVGTQSK